MKGSPGDEADRLESALLFLGRSLQALAHALSRLLAPASVEELARAAGRRRPGLPDAAHVVADRLVREDRYRRLVTEQLLEELPPPLELPEDLLIPARQALLRRSALLAVLRQDLTGDGEADWARAATRLAAWDERLAAAPAVDARPAGLRPEPERPVKGAETRARKLQEEKHALQERLRAAQREIARLQDDLGREHQRREALREELAELRARAAEAERRASEAKRRLKEAASPSERERLLAAEAEEAAARLRVLEQKYQILEVERDDLRACLEDHDRFSQVVEEALPSFRDRPLTREEIDLAARIERHMAQGAAPFRILVVGGGEPQHRHRDKFEEYAEVLRFTGSWRMAEYTSWHKEIDLLSRDMARNFDALVVLHWNRTTFTRRAREICNQHGQKPCLTCHYEGFVSLRRTLQECLRQLLERPQAAA